MKLEMHFCLLFQQCHKEFWLNICITLSVFITLFLLSLDTSIVCDQMLSFFLLVFVMEVCSLLCSVMTVSNRWALFCLSHQPHAVVGDTAIMSWIIIIIKDSSTLSLVYGLDIAVITHPCSLDLKTTHF